jgi:hypothetical protein
LILLLALLKQHLLKYILLLATYTYWETNHLFGIGPSTRRYQINGIW